MREGRRELGREQERIALAKRDAEVFRQVKDHLAARLCPARLDIAQVPTGDSCPGRQLQLREMPPLAPLAEHVPDDGLHTSRHYRRPALRSMTSQVMDLRLAGT